MANSGSNFSILADVELNFKNIQQQLNKHKITFNIDGQSIKVAGMGLEELGKQAKTASENTDKLSDSGEYVALTFQEANLIMQRSIELIASMVEQVYELDGAITELKKVSDLSGSSLDNYVAKLTDMGDQVARTGKPKRLARKVRMVNVL